MSRVRLLALALTIGYGALYLVELGVRPLARMDEFRYVEIAREMLVSGDWVSPRLNGLRYFEKPVLGHWLGAASLAVFGENSFAARLPSAMATGLTALLVAVFLSRLTRDRATGLLAAFIVLTCPAVFGVGTTDTLDPLLTLWLSLAVGSYFCAWREAGSRRRAIWLAVVGLACGLAFLTKGFLAFAVPVIVVAPFLTWQRQWPRLGRDLWIPLGVALLVALPWALSIHRAEPDFWRYFFFEEHLRRFTAGDAQHSKPFWYLLAGLPVMALPWTLLIPAGVDGLKRHTVDRSLLRYLVLWLLLPLAFFSASRGKLLTYILPCFPPLAMLLAIGLRRCTDPGARYLKNGLRGILLLCGALLLGLSLNRFGCIGRPVFDATESWRWGSVALALVVGAAACLLALRRTAGAFRVLAPGLAIIPLLLVVPFAIPNATRVDKMPADFLETLAKRTPPETILVSDAAFVHPVAWVFKRSDLHMMTAGELGYGLSYPEDRDRLLDAEAFRRLIEESAGRRPVLVALKDSRESLVLASMPDGARRLSHGELVVWQIPLRSAARTATRPDDAGRKDQ